MNNIADIFAQNAKCDPLGLGLFYEGASFTHGELFARMCKASNGLLAQGFRRGDRLALLSMNSNQLLELYGAAALAGLIAVPINYRLSVDEMKAVLADCNPSGLLFESQYQNSADALLAAVPSINFSMRMDGGSADPYEALLAASPGAPPRTSAAIDDTAFLIYTSGTTGKAKGVMLSHRALLVGARGLAYDGLALPTDRMLIVMPLYHIGGMIEQLAFAIRGGSAFLQRQFREEAVLKLIQDHRITAAHFGPIMVQRLLAVPNNDRYDLSSLRLVHYGSAPMAVELLKRAIARFGSIFTQVYALTEGMLGTILQSHRHLPDGSPDEIGRLASAGLPFGEGVVRVVREDGSECDVGEIGEVAFSGPGNMSGYWNNTQLTLEVMSGGWLYTGDMGYFDELGYLFIADRKKDMIISGGENIYSREVEEILMLHEAVDEVAVIGVPDREWGESIKACVVLKETGSATADDLINHCRTKLATYKSPKTVDFLPSMPRLHNGKVDKKTLRVPYWQERRRQVS